VQENAVGTIGKLGAYTVVDLKLRWQARERISINAGVNNLLDEKYATQRRTGSQKGVFPGPTRAFYVSTTLEY
jgi:Fe(3+) dicitrate transport protein